MHAVVYNHMAKEYSIYLSPVGYEPSPCNTGSLKKLHEKGGMHLTVKPGQKLLWKIVWEAVT